MALRQVMLAKQIADAEENLNNLRAKATDFETREKELTKAIDEAGTEEERAVVEEQVNKFTSDQDANAEEIRTAEDGLKELRSQLDLLNAKKPKNPTGGNQMGKRNKEEIEEVRSGINSYVKSKGQTRDGFTSVEGGALIPEELLAPQKTPEDVIDLRTYVKRVSVNTASGKYPVISKSGGKMVTVAELEKNPELAKPNIKEIDFAVDTRRGYIPVSQEVIDDASYDVVGLISEEITDQARNTSNADIAAVLKTAPAKTVTGVDGLKDLVNKDIKKVYLVKFIVSASLYAELDKLKDKNGRYLLQDSIVTQSGKMLLGREVIVLDDIVIGSKAGDLVGFVGDASSFCAFFDRKQTSVKWIDNQIYGELLAGIVRYDVKATDTDAGFYVTYKNDATGGSGE